MKRSIAVVFTMALLLSMASGVQAIDSPIVDQRGDSSQWVAGLGVAYSW